MANQTITLQNSEHDQVEQDVPEKINWLIPIGLFSCVLLAFFDKISIAALFSDEKFQQALGIDFDPTRFGVTDERIFIRLWCFFHATKRYWR
ncbi:Uncharacterised protein [Providencia rettgeri]|uniref:Uncharacterized protein n=1 Tax=Providencia rettgeri TaxID=587 RepID=A0A379FWE3_PRORE|nr:Uncharacterised protein [Providencia rettgeri]